MLISVIVPFYNEELFIERCIRSLLNQDFEADQYELIFIDNGSDDRSVEIVKKFSGIKLLHEHQKNPYTARNRALKEAKGKITAFTDADCVVSKDWLKIIYDEMKADHPTILLGNVLFPAAKSVLVSTIQDYQNAKIAFLLKNRKNRYLYGYTNNMAVSSVIFHKLGHFIEWPVPGDTEIIHRALKRIPGTKVRFREDMEVLHLEIGSALDWMKKSYLYGRHNTLLSLYADYKPFNYFVKNKINRFCCKKYNYALKKMIILRFMQTILSLTYATGMIRGYFKFILLKGYREP